MIMMEASGHLAWTRGWGQCDFLVECACVLLGRILDGGGLEGVSDTKNRCDTPGSSLRDFHNLWYKLPNARTSMRRRKLCCLRSSRATSSRANP